MKSLSIFTFVVLIIIGLFVIVMAQQPQAPCEEQLNNEMFQKGGVTQQLAVAKEQLRVMTKERDELKATAVKPVEKK